MQIEASRGVVEKPVVHVVLSFAKGDLGGDGSTGEWGSQQKAQLITAEVLERIGLKGHKAVLVAHQDKDHQHVHVMANRFDPSLGKSWGNQNDRFALRAAIEEVEKAHGLKPTGKNALDVGQERPVRITRLEWEIESRGGRSFPRFVREEVGTDLRTAPSWNHVHQKLASAGLRIETTSRGGLVKGEDGRTVSLGRVYSDVSFPKLEQRLGPYVRAERLAVVPEGRVAPQPEMSSTSYTGGSKKDQPQSSTDSMADPSVAERNTARSPQPDEAARAASVQANNLVQAQRLADQTAKRAEREQATRRDQTERRAKEESAKRSAGDRDAASPSHEDKTVVQGAVAASTINRVSDQVQAIPPADKPPNDLRLEDKKSAALEAISSIRQGKSADEVNKMLAKHGLTHRSEDGKVEIMDLAKNRTSEKAAQVDAAVASSTKQAVPSVESSKQPDAVRAEPEAKQAEVRQPDTARVEPTQPEVKQPEAKQPDTVRAEPIQPEAKQPDAARPEPAQPEAKQPEAKQPEPARAEPAQAEVKQPDTTRAEPTQSEAKQPETARVEPAQPEKKQPETARAEHAHAETKQPDAARAEVTQNAPYPTGQPYASPEPAKGTEPTTTATNQQETVAGKGGAQVPSVQADGPGIPKEAGTSGVGGSIGKMGSSAAQVMAIGDDDAAKLRAYAGAAKLGIAAGDALKSAVRREEKPKDQEQGKDSAQAKTAEQEPRSASKPEAAPSRPPSPGVQLRAEAEQLGKAESAAARVPGLEKLQSRQGQDLAEMKQVVAVRPELEKGFRDSLKATYRDPAGAEKTFRDLADKKGPSAAASAVVEKPTQLGPLKEEPRRASNLFKDRTAAAYSESVHVGPAGAKLLAHEKQYPTAEVEAMKQNLAKTGQQIAQSKERARGSGEVSRTQLATRYDALPAAEKTAFKQGASVDARAAVALGKVELAKNSGVDLTQATRQAAQSLSGGTTIQATAPSLGKTGQAAPTPGPSAAAPVQAVGSGVSAVKSVVAGKGPDADAVMNTMGKMASKSPVGPAVNAALMAKNVVRDNLSTGVER